MGSAAPDLPTRFPRWCRAVYSWGGESDKDLGFIEGDLIECLNAGDGSWWMGRLRRDRRMMGFFPSNFVIVLEEGFAPASRAPSPLPEQTTPNKNSVEEIQKQKTKARSRKPFQGYKNAVGPGTPTPVSSPHQSSLAHTPVTQERRYDLANPPSTMLWQQRPHSRGPSRSPSPLPHHDINSSPPPPPPPHRHGIGSISRHTPSPQPPRHDQYESFPHSRTPSAASLSLTGHTPPMLRDAMEGVMSSLEDMGMQHREANPEPPINFNPWSPEAFDDLARPSKRPNIRPLTSLGLGAGGSHCSDGVRQNYSSRHNSPDRYTDGPPQLSTYVQRMESRLRQMQVAKEARDQTENHFSDPPEPPPKNSPWNSRPVSSAAARRRLSLRERKSAHDLGRTYTTKTTSTDSSSGFHSNATMNSNVTSMTSQSVMSGQSAGGFSATSAGSLARRNKFGSIRNRLSGRPMTSAGTRSEQLTDIFRPQTPVTGPSYLSSHDARPGAQSAVGWEARGKSESISGLGGLSPVTPKAKKTGFFKKLIDSAKTGAASARSNIAVGQASSTNNSPARLGFNNGITGIAGGSAILPQKKAQTRDEEYGRDATREMGLQSGAQTPWVITRRDVNRSNTPQQSEKDEIMKRCQMLDIPVICPVDELFDTVEGNEGLDGHPVRDPFQLNNPSYTHVDKAAKFITSLPATITPATLAQGYVCRPHRSDVHRLRAIFTWCAERIGWEEDFEGEIDTRRVIQAKRGSSLEVSELVVEMCAAINIHAEVVQGYLKSPGEDLELDALNRPNHHWNAILVDGEWRMMDCSLASPTNPGRGKYSSVATTIAEPFYFLAKPLEFCYTHIPLDHAQQHLVPAVSPDVLLALPCALPAYFRQRLALHRYDTSTIRLESLEVCTLAVSVPADVELVAEVETKSFLRDQDGDVYENVDAVTRKRALTQPTWCQAPNHLGGSGGILQKRYVVKALLPGDEGIGVLKIYAGKKGMMHSAKDIVHPLALALPLYHQGDNPEYSFLTRHPTPHAMRHDLYVVQPQCARLLAGETFVFCVRQHAADAAGLVSTPASEHNGFDFHRTVSPGGTAIGRPGSAMSMSSSAASGGGGSQASSASDGNGAAGKPPKDKPAKLAIQSPAGKIIRLNRKAEAASGGGANRDVDGLPLGSVWETVVKVQDRGTWRGLVLADRSARWCVWGEWECV